MKPEALVETIRATLEAHRNPEKAIPMAKYMKNLFPFLGLPRPEYEVLIKPILAEIRGKVEEAWLHEVAQKLWNFPEREFQYAAVDILRSNRKALSAGSLELAEALLQQKSWWDSVDDISGDWVSPLVLRFPELRTQMDRWSRHPNFWVRRSAIIHQLGYRENTDLERLFDYCLHNAADPEFFIRKAIGWVLREYAKFDSVLVYSFVEQYQDRLSKLSVREALKHKNI